MITDLRDLLRPGITGTLRWPGGQLEPLPDSAETRWRAGVFSFARSVGDRAPAFTPAGPGRQYQSAQIRPRTPSASVGPGPLELLLHAVLPFVGARIPGEPGHACLTYLDVPGAFAGPGEQGGLDTLSGVLLNQPFAREAWMKDLVDPQAWYDMAYHAPARVGDLVFADMA